MNLLSLIGIRRRMYRAFGDKASEAPISYAVMACNEAEQLDGLLGLIEKHLRTQDELTVQVDAEKGTEEVRAVVAKHREHIAAYGEYAVNGDFATAKNHLNSLCRGEYIFQLDADETPAPLLIEKLPNIIAANPGIELFKIARNNCFDNQDGSFSQMSSWPDYQGRIFRNLDRIAWHRPLHEKIRGHERYVYMPKDVNLAIIHHKNRQSDLDKWQQWREQQA